MKRSRDSYEEAISKIDFLNNRLRKLKQPWYSWAINLNWNKIDKWCELLGYGGGDNETTLCSMRKRKI